MAVCILQRAPPLVWSARKLIMFCFNDCCPVAKQHDFYMLLAAVENLISDERLYSVFSVLQCTNCCHACTCAQSQPYLEISITQSRVHKPLDWNLWTVLLKVIVCLERITAARPMLTPAWPLIVRY